MKLLVCIVLLFAGLTSCGEINYLPGTTGSSSNVASTPSLALAPATETSTSTSTVSVPSSSSTEADCAPGAENASSTSNTQAVTTAAPSQTQTQTVVTRTYTRPQVVWTQQPSTTTTNNVVSQPESAPEKAEADCESAPATESVTVVSSNNVPPAVESAPEQVQVESSAPSSESTTTTTTTTTTEYVQLPEVAYTEVSTSLIGSDTLVDQLLTFGASHIIQVTNAKYALSDLNFTVSKAYHLWTKTEGDYIYYKFDIELENADNYIIDTVFCVNYCNSTGKIEMGSYKWDLSHFTPAHAETMTTTSVVESSNNVIAAPNVLPEEASKPAPETESVMVVEQSSQQESAVVETLQQSSHSTEQSSQAQSESAPSTTTTTTTTTTYYTEAESSPPTEEGYSPVSTSLIGSDAFVDKLLSCGASEVIRVANAKNSFTDLNFYVSKVNSLSKQQIGNRLYYKFDLELENNEGVMIETTFVVRYCIDVQTMHWLSYNYQVYLPAQQQPSSSSPSSSTSSSTTVTQSAPVVTESTSVMTESSPVVTESTPAATESATVTESSVAPGSSSASNTETAVTTLSASDCSDQNIQMLISEGSKYVVGKAIAQGAPNSSYNVSQIEKAQHWQSGGCDYYLFDVKLISADGSYWLNAEFNMEVSANGNVEVTACKFNGDKNANWN